MKSAKKTMQGQMKKIDLYEVINPSPAADYP